MPWKYSLIDWVNWFLTTPTEPPYNNMTVPVDNPFGGVNGIICNYNSTGGECPPRYFDKHLFSSYFRYLTKRHRLGDYQFVTYARHVGQLILHDNPTAHSNDVFKRNDIWFCDHKNAILGKEFRNIVNWYFSAVSFGLGSVMIMRPEPIQYDPNTLNRYMYLKPFY